MRRVWIGFAFLITSSVCQAQVTDHTGDLDKLDFEQLVDVQVTTASKHLQSLSDVPAAIYVVTQEEIHRSGARAIPEILRMVPGLQVGKATNGIWQVGARGFGGRFANKLLVLINGRSVYASIYSGVFWETLDLPLEEIDRIEVVRGPGGALWGANAVNGVINIITKRASETQDTLVSVGLEPSNIGDSNQGTIRYGSTLRNGYYRVYLHSTRLPAGQTAAGGSANDDLASNTGGFRADWKLGTNQTLSLTGEAYGIRESQSNLVGQLTAPFLVEKNYRFDAKGWNVVAKWNREFNDGNESLQAFIEGQTRDMPEVGSSEHILDVDWQREVHSPRSRLIYGLDIRTGTLDTTAGTAFFQPASSTTRLASAFIHKESALSARTRLEIGAKLEAHSNTKPEILPSIRLLHTDAKNRTYWASVSRAVRTPSDAEIHSDVFLAPKVDPMSGLFIVPHVRGTSSFQSESLIAYEAGVRARLSSKTSLDAAAYFNVYDKLRSFKPGAPFFVPSPVPHIELPVEFANGLKGTTAGLEISVRHRPSPNLNLVLNLTAFSTKLHNNPLEDITPLYGADGRAQAPRYQASFASYYSPSASTDIDAEITWNDREIAGPPEIGPIPGYWLANLRFAWHPQSNLELQLSIRNVFGTKTLQGTSSFTEQFAVPQRHLYLGATYRF